ncbi:MAG: hypothetical protein EBZ48_04420 [Proteobacteria bacterium]|nr:hypothetical protein [Pseudomonadota bacterium]
MRLQPIKQLLFGNLFNEAHRRLNGDYALTAAHGITSSAGISTLREVGAGTNYSSDPGPTRGISNYFIYPGYNGTLNTPDLAILRLSQYLPGPDLTISSSSTDQMLTHAGFGRFGSPAQGVQPNDYNSRGWNAPVNGFNPVGASATYYRSTLFAPAVAPLNGKGYRGDSGGPVFDSAGNLVGINIAQSGGLDSIGTTIYANLSQSEINSWINSTVPAPGVGVTFALISFGLLPQRRRK